MNKKIIRIFEHLRGRDNIQDLVLCNFDFLGLSRLIEDHLDNFKIFLELKDLQKVRL